MMKLQVGVKAFLRNEEGKFLLLKRNSLKYGKTRGIWDIVGGRINPGTSLVDNLKREVREETGLEVVSVSKVMSDQDIFTEDERHVVRLTYVCDCKGEIELDKDENTEYKWLDIDEIKNINDLDSYAKEILLDGLKLRK